MNWVTANRGTVLDHAVLIPKIPKPESGGPWILTVVSGVFFGVQFGGKIFFSKFLVKPG